MGTSIDREAFDEVDDARFQERLEQCLSTLGELLERPGFGVGPVTLGAELELFLVDGAARPLQHNQAVRAAAADARVNLELDRFNLELNATPTLLAGQPFTALGEELRLLLGRVAEAARAHGGRPVLVGILPTLRRADLGARVISDLPRYRALNSRLRGLHHDPFHLRIAGADPLELASDDVALEGAATSFRCTCGSIRTLSRAATTRPRRPPRRCWRWPATRRPCLAIGCGRRPGSPCASSRSTTATAVACVAGLPAWRLAPGGCGAGRWGCSPRACGCTSRCCRSLATTTRLPAGTRGTRRRWRSCGCTRAPCGAGTGPSTTRPAVATCGSRCAPCHPAPL